ncbi:MAG: hypothetical protein EWV55_11220 [Microcystis viridis Mv_BB_P_19951000_S69]|jgi:hypothetical protein|uniref:Uncharacterized protein n=1 Tax=Microcystis viridis Mv_BB_P_19951000_S68D TaxID=2486270 RepID=A0A552HAK8_MICVR|nr:MAG: hypothetical protein EWV77_20710 [Microcystis viridis Mv_BB_P_19951000_S68D]TRU74367.1 MAG: hypothetical protein EWV55_11220 [Microcystis viridis Mv_BB_P_19951000_S69]TRU78085.1 MAG: hypothetical protein EWV47_02615 [Microcystis viridis Mv_BB_P_19951000_S68]TRU85380.1 MAG: hypothetical protein EWV46_12570 [Microcystis viridis Mv_BB_P_19951000_S69D]
MIAQPSNSNTNQSIPVKIIASRNFIDCLESQQISLAFTTYQSSQLMFLEVNVIKRSEKKLVKLILLKD